MVQRKLAAILHADLVGYSRLMEGAETRTFRDLKTLRRDLWEPEIARHKGRLVGTAGDAILVEFASAVSAVQCAVSLQIGMRRHNGSLPDERRMMLRIGINLGDVMVDEGDIFGEGVNLAARLQALAVPGGVLVSAKVREEVERRIPVEFVDAGEHQVKNIARAVRAYEVRVPATVGGPQTAEPDVAWTLVGADRSGAPVELALPRRRLREASEGLVVGRHSRFCDLVLANDSLSRRHARFALSGDVLTVEDLDSTNGTAVNGERLDPFQPTPLMPGARLNLGEIRLAVTVR